MKKTILLIIAFSFIISSEIKDKTIEVIKTYYQEKEIEINNKKFPISKKIFSFMSDCKTRVASGFSATALGMFSISRNLIRLSVSSLVDLRYLLKSLFSIQKINLELSGLVVFILPSHSANLLQ